MVNLSERLAQAAIERRRQAAADAHGEDDPAPAAETPAETSAGLPLWQRPFADIVRGSGLATVTSLPMQPRREDVIDDDLEGVALAPTIPMPGVWMSEPVIDIDRDELHLPRVTFGPIDLYDDAPMSHHPSAAALSRADDEHTCPQCGARASVDIHDPQRGRIHLSCASCFKMWQERVATTMESDEPFMRD